jgi:hypothetical protein
MRKDFSMHIVEIVCEEVVTASVEWEALLKPLHVLLVTFFHRLELTCYRVCGLYLDVA